jgi:drug/metabolite transporter (DMT)-like permease
MTDHTTARSRSFALPGVAFIAMAAALWGTDAILRAPLTEGLPASVIVFWEHALLVLATAPLLRGVGASLRRLDAGDWVSLLLIGAGASAIATALFTQSFTYGEFTTTLLLQKLQPLIVLVGAWWLLGERPLRAYWPFFAAAVGGAWLITFRDPFAVEIAEAAPALFALGAAALWGMGTVLGRRLTPKIEFKQLTALRFLIGLPATAVVVTLQSNWDVTVGASDFFGTAATPSGITVPGGLLLLAAIPGLLALLWYYRGLGSTPAMSSTLAELAFPLSAIVLNWIFLETVPDGSQWVGIAVLATAITMLGVATARRGTEGAGVRLDAASAAGG